MMFVLLVVAIIALLPLGLLAAAVVLHTRVRHLQAKLGALESSHAHLLRTVHDITRSAAIGPHTIDPPAAADIPTAEPQRAEVVPLPAPQRPPAAAHEPVIVPPAAPVDPNWTVRETVASATSAGRLAERAATAPRARRPGMSVDEWEAVIGGSWLNKLGVLVLVIGMALFLGYSMTYLGALGRVGIGVVAAITMLATGVRLERREAYRVFSAGLIGGGWAALYFTTFAMYGLEAARVLQNPLVATLALLAVASGMIAHSIRYRSQAVTGLAYFTGFITLAISPASTFSLVASVPLVVSLLIVAARFAWLPLMVCGIAATYLTYVFTAAAVTAPTLADFYRGQALVALYWLGFELFDLHAARRRVMPALQRAILPLNASGLIAVTLLQWPAELPPWWFFGTAGGVFLLSALARRALASSVAAGSDERAEPLDQGYRAALTVSTALLVVGAFGRFSGFDVNIALLLIAQVLFVSGLGLQERYLRRLAGAVLAVAVLKLLLVDVDGPGRLVIAGHALWAWTPVALLTALVLWGDRAMRGWARPVLFEPLFGPAAAAILMIALAFELPEAYVAPAWLTLSLVLLSVALRTGLAELRLQSVIVALLTVAAGLAMTVMARHVQPLPLALLTLLFGLATARLFIADARQMPPHELALGRVVASWAGVLFLVALFWHVVPREYVGLAWLLLLAPLVELAVRSGYQGFRHQGYVSGMLGVGWLIVEAFSPHVRLEEIAVNLGAASAFCFAVYARLGTVSGTGVAGEEARAGRMVVSLLGMLFAALALWHLVPPTMVAGAWGGLALALVGTGIASRGRPLRVSGLMLLGVALVKLFAYDARHLDAPFRILSFIALGLLLLAASWIYTRWRDQTERYI